MKALITISFLAELDNEDEAAELVERMTAAWQKNVSDTLAEHGEEVDALDDLLVNYGMSVSFPQPILEEDPR